MHDEIDDVDNEDDEETSADDGIQEALELDTQSQIFLEMRRQNLDLLKVAVEFAGFAGQHPAIKPNEFDGSMKALWRVYSEFYTWIDPEEAEGDDDEDEDEDEA